MSMQAGGMSRCDICGRPFLWEVLTGELVHSFTIAGINGALHCHKEKCGPALREAVDKDDWKLLPKGPLRKAFKEGTAQKEDQA